MAHDLRPVSIVEGDGFKNLLQFMEPGYRAPYHTLISKICRDIYAREMGRHRELLDRCEYVAMTTDIWTISAAVNGYVTISLF